VLLQPLQLTVAHRVYGTGEAVIGEMRRVESVGGWIKEGRVCSILAVSRAFGDWEFKVRAARWPAITAPS
jgi:hypothetical protein